MQIGKLLEKWKSIVGFIILIVGATWGFISWAEGEKVLVEAKQQLIHNEMYQESRINRKRDEIKELRRDFERIIRMNGDDTLDLWKEKELEAIEEEIKHLQDDIEEIEEKLHSE
jgi:hypothetical protein